MPSQPLTAEQRVASLSERERAIVREISRHPGEKLAFVAHALGLSESTLRNRLTLVYSKLGVRGRLELHLFATDHGLSA